MDGNTLSKADSKRREKILNGNLLSVIFTVCAPLFIYNFFSSLYNLIDTIMVSKISPQGVSSVALIGQIKDLFGALGTGIAGGAGILIARAFGEGDMEKGKKYVNVLTTLAMIIAIILLVTCIPFARPILLMLGYPSELLDIGTGYFILQIVNLCIVVYNSSFIAIQKAKGDTRSIFFLNVISIAIKLTLNFIFIEGLRVQSTIYVAGATVASQLVLFIILLIIINKKDNVFRVNLFKFSLNWPYVKKVLSLSFPIFLGKFVFSFGKVGVNAMCSKYGPLVAGALGVSNNITGLITNPLNSFEEGGSTIVSQNLGNNNRKRALKAFKLMLIISTVIGVVGYFIFRFVLDDFLISLFSKTHSQELQEDALYFKQIIKSIYRFDCWSIFSLAINSAVLGVLLGFGKTTYAMILNFARVFVFRIPVLWFLQKFHPEMGAECAGISMGISNTCIALTSIIFLIIFLFGLKHKDKKLSSKNQ